MRRKVRRLPWIRTRRTGGSPRRRSRASVQTERQVSCSRVADNMSDLLRAAENKEWDKVMVRRPLEVVWYLQRI